MNIPDAPTEMFYNCIVAINQTTYLIAQGEGDPYDARNTYFFNFEKRTLLPGPQFNTARLSFGCSRIKNPTTGLYDIIVAGGASLSYNALNSTEIFDVTKQIWRLGPILPLALYGAPMVEHYKGGVILIGGSIQNNTPQKHLYHLTSANEEWYIMENKMSQQWGQGGYKSAKVVSRII